jgi:hypothetical protein
MYLLLTFLQVCSAAARLVQIRICDLVRSAVSVEAAADAFTQSAFHISLGLSRTWVLPTGDAGLAPSRLHIASAASQSTTLAPN